jgi:hypothetical protein
MSEVIIPYVRDVRLHGKIPRIDNIVQSYPMRLLDGTMSRIKLLPFFSSFNFSSYKGLIIQPSSIPFCGIYLLQEMLAPDGDANTGEIRFRTAARIGFSVIIQNNDPVAAEYKLDAALQAITVGLFSDSTYYNNKSFRIQGFVSGSRQHVFGRIGTLDNETPIAELRYELVVDLGVITYPPNVPDILEVIHLETRYPAGSDPTIIQQVKSEYDIEQ